MEDRRRKIRREKREDLNPMEDINLLEILKKNVGTTTRLDISEGATSKRRRRRRKRMIIIELEKYSQEDGGDSFVAILETCAS
jgi:hypothetical protein